jgi:tetratricopeptide (TPR) repeat protein
MSDGATIQAKNLRVLAKLLIAQNTFSRALGHTERAEQLLQQATGLLDRPELVGYDTRREKASLLDARAWLAERAGHRTQAQQMQLQGLEIYRALDDRWQVATILHELGHSGQSMGIYQEARQWDREALDIFRGLGDLSGIQAVLSELAATYHDLGAFEPAERLRRESLALAREIGERRGLADSLYGLGTTLLFSGKLAECRSLYEESEAIYDELDPASPVPFAFMPLALLEVMCGQYEQARERLLVALAYNRERNWGWGTAISLFGLGDVALAQGAYEEAQRWLQESVAVLQSIGHRSNVGWPLASWAGVARGLGQPVQAREHIIASLRGAAEIGEAITPMFALPQAALLLADRGEVGRTVELYALASRHPFVANSRWFEDVAGNEIAALAESLPPDVAAAAQERGRACDLWATVEKLLVELEGEDRCPV